MAVSLVGIVLFLIGLGLLVSAIFSIVKIRRQVGESVKTTGTVIGFGKTTGKSGYIYCPQITFTDFTGKRTQFQSQLGTQPPAFTIGQHVQIIYQRNTPHKAEIDSLTSLWFVPVCMSLVGIAFIFLGVVLFFVGFLVQFGTYTNNGK